MSNNLYPRQGDIVVINAEPHAGREYGGHDPEKGNIRRHMVVVSNSVYNLRTGLFVGMPITTSRKYANDKRYMPILIPGSNGNGVKGYIILWQIQNFDFHARHGVIVNRIQRSVLKDLINTYVNAIYELDS